MDFASTGWEAGETVSVYAVSLTPPYAATGSAVTTAVASSSGVASFTGLDAGEYRASGGTSGRAVRLKAAPRQARSTVVLTQDEYDSLSSPDDSTLYVISG